MSDVLKDLDKKLADDKDLAAKFEQALKDAPLQGAANDAEVLVAAARAVGVQLTCEEAERAIAQAVTLSEQDLEQEAGGAPTWRVEGWDEVDWDRAVDIIEDWVGYNDSICGLIWNCYAAFMHSTRDDHNEACWSDYRCIWFNN